MKTCIFCGAEIPEARQVCERCEELFKPHTEIINAMFKKYPVEHNGIKYGCISAVTIRARSCARYALDETILQVELMSKYLGVVIADPRDITICE